MKVFAISDLHLSTSVDKPMDIFGEKWQNYWDKVKTDWQEKVSDDDIVLMAGDFSWAMRMSEALSDFALFDGLKGKKVILRGNHDYWWNTIGQVRAALPNGFYALQNDCLRFGDLLICGTRGWIVPDGNNLTAEDNKIFLREVERMKLSLAAMEKERSETDKVVCMMHFPPFNGRRDDSEFIRLLIENDIRTVVYGHLHGKDCRIDKYVKKFGIDFWLTSADIVDFQLTEIPV